MAHPRPRSAAPLPRTAPVTPVRNAQLVVYPATSHAAMLQHPEAQELINDFLSPYA